MNNVTGQEDKECRDIILENKLAARLRQQEIVIYNQGVISAKKQDQEEEADDPEAAQSSEGRIYQTEHPPEPSQEQWDNMNRSLWVEEIIIHYN